MFQVFLLPQVEKELKKQFDKKELLELKNFVLGDLTEKGDKVGDQLTYPFLREKKISGKRIYYLIYKKIVIILVIATSNKKSQKDTINEIKLYLPEYKKYAYELYEKIKKNNF